MAFNGGVFRIKDMQLVVAQDPGTGGSKKFYRSAISQQKAQRRLVGELLHKAFDGSAASLVMQALSSKRASPEEIAEIRALLDQLDPEGS